MKRIFIFLFTLTFSFSYCQINYCDGCGKFENDKIDFYKKVSKINTKQYKGSPIFAELDDTAKRKLLEETTSTIYSDSGKISVYEASEWISGFETRKKGTQFTYDDNENVIELLRRFGPTKHKETFKFDDAHSQITKHIYKYNGVEIDRIVKYSLNDKGLVTNRKEFFGDGNFYTEDKSKFDSNGNEIFSDYYCVKTTTTYKYDNSGNILSKRSTNNHKKGSKMTYKYNNDGQVTEEKHYKINGALISNTTYEYQNNLLIKKIEKQYSNGKVYSTQIDKYEYNERENWITKLTERNDILISVTERMIEYK